MKLSHVNFFKNLLGEDFIIVDKEEQFPYSHDETEDLSFYPSIVLKPKNTEHVSKILKYCFDNDLKITPQGARTGLSGGALPVGKSIALSLERFNRIINIDEDNLQVTVEPSVIVQVLQDAVESKGLFYPPDPASKGSCFIGGNLAENSGGPKAVKYGVTADYVLNLEIVLPNGDVIWTGANTLKNATGYNLTQLMVGSEGTLGVITKAVLKLIPLPKFNKLLLVSFSSSEKACESVSEIFKVGIIPSGLEFMERDAVIYTASFINDQTIIINDNMQAQLLIEVDGDYEEVLMNECEIIMEVVERFEAIEVLFADSQSQKDKLWELRRKVGEAVKSQTIYKEEDTVVPRFELPKLIVGVKKIGDRFGFKSICYGHAGDGNLHINILKGDMTDQKWENELSEGIREIFELTVKLGGTISGEHGIGFIQKNYMDIPFSNIQLDLMKSIKEVFDAKGILNPGKIFPD